MKANRPKEPVDFQPDFLGEIPMTIARFALWGGMAVTALCVIGIFLLMSRASGEASTAAQVASNMGLFQKGLTFSVLALACGSAWLFWEEEIMVGGNLMAAAVLFFAPTWIPMAMALNVNPGVQAGYNALEAGGKLYFGLAIAILIGDIVIRVKARATHGTKADMLKYGKGVKEESDRQNVFMGKCWQLPFCRKFVREKCPIYHAQRTCWRELAGCMCEEEVIKIAMDGKIFSKEALLSGAAIPRNNKITVAAKRERCRNCVIYNEHQKHKYKIAMPLTIGAYILVYVVFHETLLASVSSSLGRAGKAVESVSVGALKTGPTSDYFVQFLAISIMLVGFAYTVKLVEFAIFKLKI